VVVVVVLLGKISLFGVIRFGGGGGGLNWFETRFVYVAVHGAV